MGERSKNLARILDSMPSIIPSKDKRKFGEKLRVSWNFETVYEKIILVILGMLGVWKAYELVMLGWNYIA